VDFNQSYSAPLTAGVETIALNFDADVADLNVIPLFMPNELVRLDVSAKGSTGIFSSNEEPVRVVFERQTTGNTLSVNSDISRSERWPFSINLRVSCDLYLNPSYVFDLDVRTSVGQVKMNNSAVPVIFQELLLHSTTGNIEINIPEYAVLTKNVSLRTTTGNVNLAWNNPQVTGPILVDVSTTTGAITTDVTQTIPLAGNVLWSTKTTTGGINFGMHISGPVGAEIVSETNLGGITLDVQSFNGNRSPIYSSNYPAANNFMVDLGTTTGSIHIEAAYQGSPVPPMREREQIREAIMLYIRTNHPETAQFMQNLTWTGGLVESETVGAEVYSYFSGGWNVTLVNPVIPAPTYSVTADYKSPFMGIPYRVVWKGTWQSGNIIEEEYTFAQ
jgi:hypothetical protein